MAFLYLTEIQSCVTKSQILEIVFGRSADILFPSNIVANRLLYQEGVLKHLKITLDGVIANGAFLDGLKGVFQLCRIRE